MAISLRCEDTGMEEAGHQPHRACTPEAKAAIHTNRSTSPLPAMTKQGDVGQAASSQWVARKGCPKVTAALRLTSRRKLPPTTLALRHNSPLPARNRTAGGWDAEQPGGLVCLCRLPAGIKCDDIRRASCRSYPRHKKPLKDFKKEQF